MAFEPARRDLPCTPLAVAYALVTMDAGTLFIAPGRVMPDAKHAGPKRRHAARLRRCIDAVHALPAEERDPGGRDAPPTTPCIRCQNPAHKTVKAGADPTFALKGVKNETELDHTSAECHIRDGVAMVRFQMDLEKPPCRG